MGSEQHGYAGGDGTARSGHVRSCDYLRPHDRAGARTDEWAFMRYPHGDGSPDRLMSAYGMTVTQIPMDGGIKQGLPDLKIR